jgi:hypothetical protein
MPTNQSNKQTQNVKVTVNNRIDSKCCDDKKKKRRKPRKPSPPPEEINEFPVLNTPMRNSATPNISALPVRNTVYIPPAVQISPEGMAPPVPEYFRTYYTNMTQTMEDMRRSMMSEIDDVRRLIPIYPAMTNEGTQTTPDPIATQTMPPPVMDTQGTQTIIPVMPASTSRAGSGRTPAKRID